MIAYVREFNRRWEFYARTRTGHNLWGTDGPNRIWDEL